MIYAELLADATGTSRRRALLAGFIAFAIAAATAHGRQTPYNGYELLANAFAQGRIAIDWPGDYIDALPYDGAHWIIEAPFPALLLWPFVAIFGHADQTMLTLLLCGVAVGLCWLTCERLGVSVRSTAWVCTFLFAGTTLWWCAMLGDVWFTAHVAAVACTFVALAEVAGARRGWLVALGAVAAAFSRFSVVLAIPVFAWLVLRDRAPAERRGALLGFAGVLAAGAAVWTAYNYARWGVWYDIGYTEWYHQDGAGQLTGSPFQLQYLPMQLYSFFEQQPEFLAIWPYAIPGFGGVALTYTSPALVVALFARRPAGLVIALWIATLLVAGPSFIYYVNGFAQFGMRHALDFEPFLVVLMALAMPQRVPWPAKLLVVWSVAVSTWGVWFWNAFYRH